ncbi:MAG: hypothetical protein HDT30_13150 [Clostridiales bacterium]|nr:hypothetical protein [Clostridiales bacterium]
MYYAGMTGTRNVPMQTKLEGMGNHTLERTVNNEIDTQSQQEQEKKREDTYKLAGDMQYLVEAETISNIEEVKGNLQDKKLEISNSDMDEIKKKISLQQLQSMEDRCNIKIKKLRFELSLEKMIAEAEKDGDKEQAKELRQEYVREKNLRKTGEYSELQHFLNNQKEVNEEKKAYSIYNNVKQKENKLLHEMSQTGNFVDLQSI